MVEVQDGQTLQMFWGGTDVNPALYNEPKHKWTDFPDLKRDQEEKLLFEECVKNKIPMLGICRGSQFLNVMNGGKLNQDITGHAIRHTHRMEDLRTNQLYDVNSTHHQMMIPSTTTPVEVIGIAPFKVQGLINPLDSYYEVLEFTYEVLWYPDTLSLCVQYHPEQMPDDAEAVKWLKALVKEKLNVDLLKIGY
jgi:gamma-glutamyl-gamma-aminobutyrate hydrolase PuuD